MSIVVQRQRWSDRERLGIALAAAIALHEILAALIPSPAPTPQPPVVALRMVTIVKRATPAPTPKPTPLLTPPPRPTLAAQTSVRAPAAKAAATPHAHLGGAAAPKRIVVFTPRPIPPQPARPISLAAGTHSGQQSGGAGTGAGPGNGTSGLGGTGSGTATTGNGNGGDTNSGCGVVDLLPGRVEYKPDGTVLQYVIARVVTENDVLVGVFPYPFVYPSERDNPFAHEDLKLARDNGVPLQSPPPGFDPSIAPAAVQFVLQHTNLSSGLTTLPECQPTASSSG